MEPPRDFEPGTPGLGIEVWGDIDISSTTELHQFPLLVVHELSVKTKEKLLSQFPGTYCGSGRQTDKIISQIILENAKKQTQKDNYDEK